jgi:hypothetical protein
MHSETNHSKFVRHLQKNRVAFAAVCALTLASCSAATGDELTASGARADAGPEGAADPGMLAPGGPGTGATDPGSTPDAGGGGGGGAGGSIGSDAASGGGGSAPAVDSGSGGGSGPVADSGSGGGGGGGKTGFDAGGGGGKTGTDAGGGGGGGVVDSGSGGVVDSGSGGGTGTTTMTSIGKHVMTWYSFQDNTPVNSAISASGRPLIPYISVALPFRFLKGFGGTMNYGDKLYVEFLAGKTMPNGLKHTGWVQIDDYCGDGGSDAYCFQTMGGVSYPNVDLFIGDFTKSGMDPKACTGPAGSGTELTNVSSGTPGSAWIGSYGGSTLGSGKCGDFTTAKSQQGSCWDYTPPVTSCSGCSTTSCSSW